MSTLLVTDPVFLEHDTGPGHPESIDRARAVMRALDDLNFQALPRAMAPFADRAALRRAHDEAHVTQVLAPVTESEGWRYLDRDTVVSLGSAEAALRAAGAVIHAIDAVVKGDVRNAFCAVRPPGHHAERRRPMGFCLFNNVAIGALHAQAIHGLARVAVVDVDVHHGNGTQDIFWDEPSLFYLSTHQAPFYPGTGDAAERGAHGNVVNVPLPAGSNGARFRAAYRDVVVPALRAFAPEFLLISAGFDAHADDPLAALAVHEQDFAAVTTMLCDAVAESAQGRVVSVLEGGYDLDALAASVTAHVHALRAAS